MVDGDLGVRREGRDGDPGAAQARAGDAAGAGRHVHVREAMGTEPGAAVVRVAEGERRVAPAVIAGEAFGGLDRVLVEARRVHQLREVVQVLEDALAVRAGDEAVLGDRPRHGSPRG